MQYLICIEISKQKKKKKKEKEISKQTTASLEEPVWYKQTNNDEKLKGTLFQSALTLSAMSLSDGHTGLHFLSSYC